MPAWGAAFGSISRVAKAIALKLAWSWQEEVLLWHRPITAWHPLGAPRVLSVTLQNFNGGTDTVLFKLCCLRAALKEVTP